MFGILVDVSGSMKRAYAVDRSSVAELNVEGTHAVLTSTMSIVKRETVHHERRESVFVCAFGLSGPTVTCDLISLLEYIAGPTDSPEKAGHQELIDFIATQHRAPEAESWIKKNLSPLAARILYEGLRLDTSKLPELISLIVPSNEQKGLLESAMSSLRTYSITHDIIDKALQSIQKPKPRPVQYVAEMLDDLVQSKESSSESASASAPSSSSKSLHDRIHDVLKPIKPYIYGRTPMCKALTDAVSVFREFGADSAKSNVLFILSDGMATDGDPRLIARQLHDLRQGVIIATCFLTSDPSIRIDNPRCLYDAVESGWSKDGRSVLFEISSTMRNTEVPLRYLSEDTTAKWTLPPSGESHLFIQVNSLEVVDEFCTTVVSRLTEILSRH